MILVAVFAILACLIFVLLTNNAKRSFNRENETTRATTDVERIRATGKGFRIILYCFAGSLFTGLVGSLGFYFFPENLLPLAITTGFILLIITLITLYCIWSISFNLESFEGKIPMINI
jgi:hypothetical protein